MNNITLFGSFNINNPEEFEKLILSLNKEQSIYFLTESAKFAYKQGCFSLSESELISKCIRQLYLPDVEHTVNEKRDE